MRRFSVLAAVVGLALLAACAESGKVVQVVPEEEAAPEEAVAAQQEAVPEEGQVVEIVVIGTEFGFDPADLHLTVGQRTRLVFKNEGLIDHDLVLKGIPVADLVEGPSDEHMEGDEHMEEDGHAGEGMGDVHLNAMFGESVWVEFTPTESGTYEMVCTYAGHLEAGMVGRVVVE